MKDRLWSALPGVIFLAAVAAIMAVAGLWFWSVVQPRPQTIGILPPGEPGRLAIQLQAHHLFGSAGLEHASQAAQSGNLRLVGAMTGEGIALIAIDGRPALAFHTGAEVVAGVRLTSVSARRVELDRRGEKEVLKMPDAGLLAASRSK